MCFISGHPYPLEENNLSIAELRNLPISSILTLANVIEYNETIEHNHSKFRTNKIVIISRGENIDISVITPQTGGSLSNVLMENRK